MSLQEKFKEYLDQSEVLKTLNADLKDASRSNELNGQIELLAKELKQIKDKLANVTEVALIKENRDAAKDRLGLLKEILIVEMNEAGETEVTFQGKKAKIVPSMIFEKNN